MGIFEKLFGTHSERELKRIYPIVDKIESLRDAMMALSDDELKAKKIFSTFYNLIHIEL